MPGRDFDQARDFSLLRHAQTLEAVAGPAVEEIVSSGLELPGGDPIEVFLLRSIIIGAIEKRDQPHGMPAQRLDVTRRNLALPVIVSHGAPEESAAIGRPQGFKRVGIEPGSADSGENREKEMMRQVDASCLAAAPLPLRCHLASVRIILTLVPQVKIHVDRHSCHRICAARLLRQWRGRGLPEATG